MEIKYNQNDLSISFLRTHEDFTLNHTHTKDEYEIYYLFSGERNIFINDNTYLLTAGSLAVLDASKMHRIFSLIPMPHQRTLICIDKNSEAFSRYFSELEDAFVLQLSRAAQQEAESLLMLINYELKLPDKHSKANINALITCFLTLICRNSSSTAKPVYYSRMNHVTRYINDNYNAHIDIKQMAKISGLSVSYFANVFKSTTGFTFIEYLNLIRVQKAAGLLESTQLPMSKIAFLTGFTNQSYFGKVFKEITNMPPLTYRKLHNK